MNSDFNYNFVRKIISKWGLFFKTQGNSLWRNEPLLYKEKLFSFTVGLKTKASNLFTLTITPKGKLES